MTIKNFVHILTSVLVFGAVLAPVIASASTTLSTKAMTTAVAKADKEITRRIAALTDANARVQAMQEVTAAFKTSLSTALQAQIDALNALKVKIDADTDPAVLKTDVQSVTKSYGGYALALKQARIAAAADREVVIAAMLNTLGIKLQARIASAQSAGQDTTALSAALTDMSAKLSDAGSQAQAAVSATASLVPDNDDKTIMATNTAAFKTAHKDLQAAQQDLVAARKDTATILKGLKVAAKASATATTTTNGATH